MSVDIKFEIENKPERAGLIAENTYLWDAAKRLGVPLIAECEGRGTCDTCAMTVLEGGGLLSAPTTAELEVLSDERRAAGERLACQTKIERSGEITVMVKEKVVETDEEKKERNFRQDFQELPLEKKFATLVEIETVALGETVNFIANLPFTIGNKVVDLMAKFGWEAEKQFRTTRRPTEHQSAPQAKSD
jgi:ferredoxin